MSSGAYALVLRLAVAAFLICLPLAQWAAFRELERRGRTDELIDAHNMRDHVLAALARAAFWTLIITVPVLVIWVVLSWGSLGARIFLGMELFFGFLVLALGLAAVTVRFGLESMARVEEDRAARSLRTLRLAVLALGGGYGAALWIYLPGGVGETLLAVFLIGAALFGLGLNRTADMRPDLLARLSRTLRRPPE